MTSLSLRLFHNSTSSQKILKLSKSFLVHFALISLILEQFLFVASASAQALPINPDGTTNTQVTQTASGVDQVNIAAPNANGLSHNKFTDYNVNTGGQVINNFSGHDGVAAGSVAGSNAVTQTQIGGLVTVNPNFSDGVSAKVILNEVTSGNNTQLLGYTEIAGSKADLIIANPNGISCRGCGFLSTSHLTFVAGSSNFDSSGNLGFNLKEQTNPNLLVPLITVDGLGLDITNTTSTDIIASSIKLLANVYGSDNTTLTVKSGEGRYDYQTKEIANSTTSLAPSTTPLFAIDASSLAKIQSGRIFIVATKEGVGVNMASEVLASNEVNIDANGDVYYANVSAGDKVSVKSTKNISSLDSNSIISAPNLTLQSGDEFKNLGSLSAYNLDILNSGTLTNSGQIEALALNLSNITNINNFGSFYGENSLNIGGTNLTNNFGASIFSPQSYSIALTGLLTNSGTVSSGSDLTIFTNQLANNSASEISAQNNLSFAVSNSVTNSGNLIAGNAINVTANSLNNSGVIQSDDTSTFNLVTLATSQSSSIYSGKDLSLALSGSLTNYGEISTSQNLTITGTASLTNHNQMLAIGDLSIVARDLTNGSDAIISSISESLSLALSGDLQNAGEISAATSLAASANNFTNSGIILSGTTLTLNTANLLTNSGDIQSSQSSQISATSLNNSGAIKSFSTSTINATSLTNQIGATIFSSDDLTITSALINSGTISSQNNFALTSSTLNNSGSIYSANSFNISSTGNLTNSGILYSDGGFTISAANFSNSNSGQIFSANDFDLSLTADFTNLGELQVSENLTIAAANSTNSGTIVANKIQLSNSGSVGNSGEIDSQTDLTMSAVNLTNSGIIQTAGNTQITLTNSLTTLENSLIYSGANITLTANTSLTNAGEISALDSATILANSITNSGNILANNVVTITAADLINQSADATIASINKSLILNLSNQLTNVGTIFAKENLTIDELNNVDNSGDISFAQLIDGLKVKNLTNSGNISSAQALTIAASNNFNNSGALTSQNNFTVNSQNIFTNSGTILSAQNLILNSDSLTNGGEISAQGILAITNSGSITNTNNILANGALTIAAANLTNSGAIASLADLLTLTLTNSLENSGEISAATNLAANTKNLTNSGNILSSNNLTLAITNQLTNSSAGNLQSTNDLSVTAANLDNSGSIKSFAKSTINVVALTNNIDAVIFSANDSAITSTTSLTNSGSILSSSNLDLTLGQTTNSGEIFSNGNLSFALSNTLTNSGSISSLGNVNVSSSSSITNSNQILSGGNLAVSATNLTNSNTVQSNGNLTLNLTNLTNSKNILSNGAINITASANVTNSSTLQSAGSFTINAASFTNATSSLVLAGGNLSIKSAAITNANTKPSGTTITSGLVSANGAITLQTDSLNNNSGIIAGKSTTVSALNNSSVTLLNTLGSFISSASITLDLGSLDYTITGTVTASNIDITASNITNQGNVTATDYIKLNATGINGVGYIINGSASGDNSNVKLSAGSYLSAIAYGFINNYGTISSQTDLTMTATMGNINNYSTGKITGGNGTTTITANNTNGSFNNFTGSVTTSSNDAIFNMRELNNYGEISVANNLSTNITGNLNNNATALIWGGNDLTLNVAGTLFNYSADIYATRNLTIQKNTSTDSNQNKTNLVQNVSGNIETYNGDILIKAGTLTNSRSSMKTQIYTLVNWYNCHCGHEDHYGSSYTASITGTAGLASNISSGNNLNIITSNLTNDASNIFAVGNLVVNASSINNNSYLFESYVKVQGDWWWKYPPNWPSVAPQSYSSESYLALIKSGGSLTGSIASQINNTTIAQNTSVNANAKQSQSTSFNKIDTYSLGQTGVVNVDLSGIAAALSASSTVSNGSDLNMSDGTIVATSLDAVSAKDLTKKITASHPSNTSGSDSSQTSSSQVSVAQTTLDPNTPTTAFSGNYKINLDPASTKPLVEARSQFTDVNKFFGSKYYFDQLGLNGAAIVADIDRQSRTPGEHTRMLGDAFVESNLIRNQLMTLTNDSLLLSKNNTQSDAEIKTLIDNSISEMKRLGLDAENVAMKGLTQSQANSLSKDIVTFETTTVNGVNVLAPKIYLSLDTRNRLLGNSDSNSPALATNSTIFAGGDLTINSPTASLMNNGTISSGKDLTLNVASFTSTSKTLSAITSTAPTISSINSNSAINTSAAIKSLGNLSITAGDSLSIKNTILDSGAKISLSAAKDITLANDKDFGISSSLAKSLPATISISSIKDDAATARSSAIFNATSDIQLTSAGSINIANNYLNTSGSIFMTAASDINNSNYTIKAADNVVMSAININNIHKDTGYTTASGATTNETRIEAGNMVSLDATNNINNIGATIKAGDLLYLTAGNNINNQALVNYKINGSSTNADGSAITEAQALASDARNISSTLVGQGNLTAGGNLVLVAGNDINNKGSNITATGSSYLEATAGDINVTTAALRDKTFAEGGSKKKHWVSVTDNTTNIESSISSGGTLDLASLASDINIKGSSLTSADNLTLTAKNDVNITSAQDSTYSYSAGRTGRGKSYLNRSESTTQIGSDLTTTNNGDISITSGYLNTDTIGATGSKGSIGLIASNLTTKDTDNNSLNNSGSGDINLTAKEDINISSALDYKHTETLSGKKTSWIKKSHGEEDVILTNVSSNISASGDAASGSNAGDINLNSGNNTTITASNLAGENGNIIVGKYTDPTDSTTITYNPNALLTIKSGQDYHRHVTTDMHIKKDAGAIVVGAVVAGAVAFFTAGAGAVAFAALGGGVTGTQSERGRTMVNITNETTQKMSTLTFNSDLSTQSGSDTTITASKLSADNATILTGKFRDSLGVDTVTDSSAKLNVNSAFNTYDNTTTIHQVKPNYVGVAVVSGLSAYAGISAEKGVVKYLAGTGTVAPVVAGILGTEAGYVAGKVTTESLSLSDPLFNLRTKNTYSSDSSTEKKTILDFNLLTTE